MKLIYSISDNPQQRIWTSILYPDNEAHDFAINIAIGMPNSILMLHDQDTDKKGNPIKPHYHLIFNFDRPYYKKKLVTKDLYLDWDNDYHLFLTLQEIQYKRIDDYIIYLTHIDNPNKHYYSHELFIGGNRQYAIDVCTNHNTSDEIIIMDILDYIESMQFSDHNFRYRSLKYLYQILYKKFGTIIYKRWNFIKQFILDYRDRY